MKARLMTTLLFSLLVFGQTAVAEEQVDQLELDASAITGNQELPRVLYIVPWKESGIGELAGKPINSLLDEVLAPVDREVFRRQVRYFDQIYGDQSTVSADE